MILGCIQSKYDDRDLVYSEQNSESLPDFYDYNIFYDLNVLDQGDSSKCVPFSISVMLSAMNYSNINIDDIYSNRPNKPEDGMEIRDALKMIKKQFNDPYFQYFRLNSKLQIQSSLIANGPCILALPVRSFYVPEFWRGNGNYGGHAVCCVGYNKEGFIIQNSWGESFGDSGKCILPYNELNNLMEAWGVC